MNSLMKENIENKYNKLNINIPDSKLTDVCDSSAIRQVLGCIIQDPSLLKIYKLVTSDFVDTFHQIIFASIFNLYKNEYEVIDAYLISDYLKDNFPVHYKIFERHNGISFLNNISSLAVLGNFKGNYTTVKKWSLLRELIKNGIDVSEFYDPNDIDIEKEELRRIRLQETDIDEIINYYRNKLLRIDNLFNSKRGRDSVKAGSQEIENLIEKWKVENDFGLSYSSQYLTTVTYGMRKKRLTVLSAASGTGKTRINIANICYSFSPKYWSIDEKRWKENPHGVQNRALYIGTEMELVQEIEPILIAYISAVPQDHIQFGRYEDGEEERVKEAIRILREEANIYLEYIPDYDITTLESIIEEYVTLHGVSHVFFDYVHTTTELISEFQNAARAKMQVREDQVLANLSLKLKELTRKYNISIDTCTQVSGDYKNIDNKDETIIRGSRAIVDKIDVGYIVSKPSKKEMKMLEPILKSGFNHEYEPNICYSVYKNRGGKYSRLKIWLYIDYDTMRVHDLFVTDYNFNHLPIEKTQVKITEDQKVIITTVSGKGKISRKEKKEMDNINTTKEIRKIKEEDKKNKENELNSINQVFEESDSELEELSEEDKKRLEYHMKSTSSVAFLENDSETPDVEMQEDDFDW